MIDRWGALLARRPVVVVIASLVVIAAAAAFAAGVFSALSVGGLDDPGSESAREARTERSVFGNHNPDIIAIYSSDELTADTPAFQSAVQDVVEGLPEDEVTSVVPYYAVSAPPETSGTRTTDAEPATSESGPRLVSVDGHSALVIISLEGDNLTDLLVSGDEVRPGLEADGLDLDIAGLYTTQSEVSEQLQTDLEHAEMIAAPVTVLLALLIFGSLVASAMPALVGAIAVIGSLAVLRLIDVFTEVNVFALNVVSLIGLGLAIDYSLFIISRFREELAAIPVEDPSASRTAIQRTLATAGRTVVFSALTVAASMSTLLVFPQVFLKSMAYGGVAAVLIAMTASLTILPATLTLLGRRIDKGRLPWLRGKPIVKPNAGRHWAALARFVMRRWAIVLPLTVLCLLAVASPFLGASWGGVNHRVLPADSPANVAFEKLEDFGPETSFANVVLEDVDETAVADYAAAVRDLRDDATATPLTQEGGTVLVQITWQDNDQTAASQDFIRDVRTIEMNDGTAMVGGLTAETVDLTAAIGSRLPWMGGIIVVVMLGLLFVAFGSVVLPFKAVVMNCFSITASFGVITWVFADGHLSNLLDFTPQGYLDVTTPILMFAIIFGLSMDYEVFLLSRIREQWDITGNNDLAVEAGVQKTGQIITSAALLLAVVIGAFATGQVVLTKMLGVGMLVALLVDATIVRAVMVPATMRLLGKSNWWAPAPLARWWEKHGLHEEGGPTSLAPVAAGYPPPPAVYPAPPGYPAPPTVLAPPPAPSYLGQPPPPPPPAAPPTPAPPPTPPPPPPPRRPSRRSDRPTPAAPPPVGPKGTVVRRPEDTPPPSPPAPPTVVAPADPSE